MQIFCGAECASLKAEPWEYLLLERSPLREQKPHGPSLGLDLIVNLSPHCLTILKYCTPILSCQEQAIAVYRCALEIQNNHK